ncbi:uncharacterized protein LOC117791298 [Drosophila innubila]|uniref:uncharacterized protein LOC117791298 n=1 Tax=Drosophila innubila TaxID=198719 RepID=UPI00148C0202|nr:uncharacterized protein LOC117791298 [Drosophila innubila]
MTAPASGVKYYFKEQLAYTEDHVLVKNLFLTNIKESLNKQQLQDHFEMFGCIEKLHLFSINNRTRNGYVIFKNPRHAAEALERKFQYVKRCRITVQPCYTWHQPDAEKLPDKPDNVNSNEKNSDIMKLNDYCLEHIFRELSDQSDRIQFARTCYRFRYIYEEMSPMLDKSIDFEIFEEMTAWKVRDFFKLSGRNVMQIEGNIPEQHCDIVCKYLGKHCTNLQSLMIIGNIISSLKMFANLNSLQNLRLFRCNLRNDDLQAIEHLNQLKKLDLSGNRMMTVKSLNYLPQSIESLTLDECEMRRHPELLLKIFGKLPQLKELYIESFVLESPCFERLINEKYCESLETLSITCTDYEIDDYYHIARLPSLRKLKLFMPDFENEIPPMLMKWLVKHKSKQLEHFQIDALYGNNINAEILFEIGKLSALRTLILPLNNTITDSGLEALFNLQDLTEIDINQYSKITDNGVLRLILACPKLQVLNLKNCLQLTNKFIHDIIFHLQDNQNNRPLPIKLSMVGTKVNKLILLNADVADRNIINVVY